MVRGMHYDNVYLNTLTSVDNLVPCRLTLFNAPVYFECCGDFNNCSSSFMQTLIKMCAMCFCLFVSLSFCVAFPFLLVNWFSRWMPRDARVIRMHLELRRLWWRIDLLYWFTTTTLLRLFTAANLVLSMPNRRWFHAKTRVCGKWQCCASIKAKALLSSPPYFSTKFCLINFF